MIASFLANGQYEKQSLDLTGSNFADLMESADVFICAAGFEVRAERAPLAAHIARNPVIVAYTGGPKQNDKTFARFAAKFKNVPGYSVCEMDLNRLERFEVEFEACLSQLTDLRNSQVVLDISGLPNFAICITVMKVRRALPTANLTLLYTEAEEYFPRKTDFERIKRATNSRAAAPPEYLSARAANMFFPSMFTGMALGHNDTCLIVFAGYEPHRTHCVIEASNPSKLVMVYGEPGRRDLKWRLDLSRIMHRGIENQLMSTEEITSTSEISDNLQLLLDYYDYLYDDHVLCICPTNSKMQAVASALAWETYPDIQLNFPIPAQYLPKRFSVDARETFAIDLGCAPTAQRFLR